MSPTKLNRVALTALLMVALPSWADDKVPLLAQPTVEIIGLQLHPSDKGKVQPWRKINVDPFRGDAEKGGEVLSKHTAIRISDVLEAWKMRGRGECYGYYLKDGDTLRTTHGKDKSLAAEVAFGSEPGAAERRGDVCLVRKDDDGTAVVFLDGCGNISTAWAVVRKIAPPAPPPPVAPPPPPKVVEAPPPEKRCIVVSTGQSAKRGESQWVNLQPLYGQGSCGPIYMPGNSAVVQGGITTSQSFTIICDQ